jgi:two-component system chemotaxis response regulator CheB
MTPRISVLVVDDSATVRQVLSGILGADPELEVMGTAGDPYVAADLIAQRIPDVITLDIEMPRMDGLTFLQKVMAQHPIPIVICSSLTEAGCETTLRALEYGAVDVLLKPHLESKQAIEEARIRICDAVKAAARARPTLRPARPPPVRPKLTADAVLPAGPLPAPIPPSERIVAVGASTGGTEALRVFLAQLPIDAPPVVIVQHMPERFTASFAAHLDSECAISVKEAADGDTVLRGRALIAPGNLHTMVRRTGTRYFVEVREGPLVCRHRPSVDVLFRSAARYAGKNAVGVIMTGMGDDGARGMAELKQAQAVTIAQDEASCVVFGMPKEAIKRGGVDKVLPLERIAAEVVRVCAER